MADVIETKLRPPQVVSNHLARVDLIERFSRSDHPINLVSITAPAGSGKSTLLAEYLNTLEADGYTCHWLSLDAGDDEPAVFARYITAALYELDPLFAEQGLAFLKANSSRDMTNYFDSLIQTLSSKNKKIALFVDDFQVISDPGILRFWNRLIAHAPHCMHMFIASRARIPLELSRKRISGAILELDQSNLNLDLSQVQHFLHDLYAIDLPPEATRILHESTEGWMVGLQLAAMAMGKSKGNQEEILKSFSAKDRDLKEYLFQSVFKLQKEEVREFLLHTAPLTRMSADLCDAVSGKNNGAKMLHSLEKSNLFLIPLDREGQWYRYHHLFAEYLQNVLEQHSTISQQKLCERAADWCIKQGQLTEAIQYCLDSLNFNKAADLIAEHSPDVAIYIGDHATIFDWMRKLPKEYHYRRPEIILYHAWSRAFARDTTTTAVSLCTEAEDLLNNKENPRWNLEPEEKASFLWLSKVIQIIAVACAEEARQGAVLCGQLLEELPESEPVLLGAMADTKAYCHFLLKELSNTTRAAVDGYSYGQKSGSLYLTVWADFLLTLVQIERGHITAADENAQRAMRNTGPVTMENSYIAALATLGKVEVEAQRCNFDQVQHHLAKGKILSSLFGPSIPLLIALRSEARMLAWNGSLGVARRSLQQGQDTALATNQSRLYFALASEEIELQLRYDDVYSAMDTVRRTDILNNESPLINPNNRSSIIEYMRMTEARLLLAENKAEEAMRPLSLAYKTALANQQVTLMQTIRTMKSIALWKLEKKSEAVRELDKVISIAAPENHAYPIVSAGSGLLDILDYIKDKRTTGILDDAQQAKHTFENRLTALLRGEVLSPEGPSSRPSQQEGPADLPEPLTKRELEILRLISAGLNNQELADELFISVSTAKWHLHNIFEKTGVRSRTAAAAYARKKELI